MVCVTVAGLVGCGGDDGAAQRIDAAVIGDTDAAAPDAGSESCECPRFTECTSSGCAAATNNLLVRVQVRNDAAFYQDLLLVGGSTILSSSGGCERVSLEVTNDETTDPGTANLSVGAEGPIALDFAVAPAVPLGMIPSVGTEVTLDLAGDGDLPAFQLEASVLAAPGNVTVGSFSPGTPYAASWTGSTTAASELILFLAGGERVHCYGTGTGLTVPAELTGDGDELELVTVRYAAIENVLLSASSTLARLEVLSEVRITP